MNKSIPVVQCPLFTHKGEQAPFSLMFYGIPFIKFMPDCDDHIREALRRRDMREYTYKTALISERRFASSPARAK